MFAGSVFCKQNECNILYQMSSWVLKLLRQYSYMKCLEKSSQMVSVWLETVSRFKVLLEFKLFVHNWNMIYWDYICESGGVDRPDLSVSPGLGGVAPSPLANQDPRIYISPGKIRSLFPWSRNLSFSGRSFWYIRSERTGIQSWWTDHHNPTVSDLSLSNTWTIPFVYTWIVICI